MRELGVSVIVARSFARIHRANLIAQGIVPLERPDGCAIAIGAGGALRAHVLAASTHA